MAGTGTVIRFSWNNNNNYNKCNGCNGIQSVYFDSLLARRAPEGYRELRKALGLKKGDKISAHRLAYLGLRLRTQDPHLPWIVNTSRSLHLFTSYVCHRFLCQDQGNAQKAPANVFELADRLWGKYPGTKTLGKLLVSIDRAPTLYGARGPNIATTEENAFNTCVVEELAKEIGRESPLKLLSTAVKYNRIASDVPSALGELDPESKNAQLERTAVVNFLWRKILLNNRCAGATAVAGQNNPLSRNGLVWELVMQRQILLDDLVAELLKSVRRSNPQSYPSTQIQIARAAIHLIEIGGKDVAAKFADFFHKLCKPHQSNLANLQYLTFMAEALVSHEQLVAEVADYRRIHEQLPKVLAALVCEYWNFSVPRLTSAAH